MLHFHEMAEKMPLTLAEMNNLHWHLKNRAICSWSLKQSSILLVFYQSLCIQDFFFFIANILFIFLSQKGVKNADINELKEIASEPDSTHVYNVADFNFMHTIVEGLTRTVCSRVEEQEKEIKGKQKQNLM